MIFSRSSSNQSPSSYNNIREAESPENPLENGCNAVI